MQLLGRTLRQCLSYGIYAMTLVWTLSVYKSHVPGNQSAADQSHWEAREATASARSQP
jgi:hypothetical protein